MISGRKCATLHSAFRIVIIKVKSVHVAFTCNNCYRLELVSKECTVTVVFFLTLMKRV